VKIARYDKSKIAINHVYSDQSILKATPPTDIIYFWHRKQNNFYEVLSKHLICIYMVSIF